MKLSPITKNLLWGGTALNKRFGKDSRQDRIAESWELTVRDDGESAILNGIYKGTALGDYCADDIKSILGTRRSNKNFPLLIKFIDAGDDLSIQVHPDDEYARLVENDSGKTEMWYVIDAEKDSKIVYGIKDGVGIKDFKEASLNGTIEQVLNYVNASSGDVFFIPSGLIHSIGKGILLAEIQQNSNITYRVYDYDRTYKGSKRELHISKAIDCAKIYSEKQISDLRFSNKDGITENSICECDFFSVKKIKINDTEDFKIIVDETSFASLLFIDAGQNTLLKFGENELQINSGDSYFIPAGTGEITLKNYAHALYTRV